MKEIIGTMSLVIFGMILSNRDRIEPWLAKKIKNWGLRMQGEPSQKTGGKDGK